MPSFSSFLKLSRKETSQLDDQEREDIGTNLQHGKLQRRQTKRHFLRSLLKRPAPRSDSNRQSGQSVGSPDLGISSPISPDKPISPMDPNKPLPLPPTLDTELEPVARPAKKLDRIISPIALPELHKLFSGAPQFFARSEGHHGGPPHPSVAFPWDVEVEIRDLCDHQQIHDEAWSPISAWPHITRDIQRSSEAVMEYRERQRANFLPQCWERPNMLSMQGLERGTMGFQAALEMGVADALQTAEGSLEDGGSDALEYRRKRFLEAKDGLRHLTESTLGERLISASTTYRDDPAKHRRPTIELYSELFTQILFPPSRVTDSDDPYSLQVQIEVLIDVLGTSSIWFDFSLVEWRIRLGQILWGPPPEDEIVVNNEVKHDLGSQKYWLLLQILLSSELLMRLDAISATIGHSKDGPSSRELDRFDKKATNSVRWSLILARYWLENIRIEKTNQYIVSDEKASIGWLSSFTGSSAAKTNEVEETVHNIQFYGIHQTRQLSGLVHFARQLKWPNTENIATKISSGGIKIHDSRQSTPMGTPRSMSTQRSNSYFSSRPTMRRGLSKQRISAVIHPSGWLSNSYISGLILPGEGMSHFLISTLLENDDTAVSRLGEEANLYGGFLYGDRSFWSTSCIVGRVLAAGKGATECIGWISSDVTPKGLPECWVNIDVDLDPNNDGKKDVKPRILQKAAIERDGHVIAGADTSSVLPGDFILPADESCQQPLLINLESLDLFAVSESVDDTPIKETPTPLTDMSESPGIQTYSAMMRFSVDADGEEKKEVQLTLSNDVYFVTAYPCISSRNLDLLKSPTSPSSQIPEQSRSRTSGTFIGHPLHKGFTYTRLPLSTVLNLPASLPFTSLLSPPQSPTGEPAQSTTHTTNSPIVKILVIDCTDSSTTVSPTRPTLSPHRSTGSTGRTFGNCTEMLARALCAQRGWNALVSRRGRGCLSCSVREASALGWRVVLRFT